LTTTPQSADDTRLYRHRRRPQWGAALIVRQDPRRITYQFQDGQQRTFRREFAAMFERIEEPAEGLESSIRARNNETIRRAKTPPVMSFSAQLRVFRTLYPGGFSDERYRQTWRVQEGRCLKQHLDPSLTRAEELLGEARMMALREAGDHTQIVEDLIAVLAGSSLIRPSRELTPLRALDADAHPALAASIHTLLHGDAPMQARVQQWIIALEQLGLPLTWSLVTVPGALLQPAEAVLVQERPLTDQSRIVGKGGPPSRLPSPSGYLRAEETTLATQERLKAAGLEPGDLLDVYVFIWETLRPRGRAILAKLGAA
jgi:hypothetical protein